ncbi:MAG: phosphoribosyltransferase [Bacteroidales bacterium]|nr:phosphoribosyltransferase [Bacteroidales bacterium]
MSAFIDFFFKHKFYNNVLATYEQAVTQYAKAFDIWNQHFGLINSDSYSDKKKVFTHFAEIINVNNWVSFSDRYLRTNKEAIVWLFYDKQQTSTLPSNLSYSDYHFIASNEKDLNQYIVSLNKFDSLLLNHKDAVFYFLATPSCNFSFDIKHKVVSNEEIILEISKFISFAKEVSSLFPKAWALFSGNCPVSSLSLEKLKSVGKYQFSIKEKFLELYDKSPKLVALIYGAPLLSISSFNSDEIEKEAVVTKLFTDNTPSEPNTNFVIGLDNSDSLKRAILGTLHYGSECKFADSVAISQFYYIKFQLETIDATFDDAIKKVNENAEAIKAYNSIHYSKECIFVGNYVDSIDPDDPLYSFIESFNRLKLIRDKVSVLKESFPLAFNEQFPGVNTASCSEETLNLIISSSDSLKSRNNTLKQIESDRLEAERKKIEHQKLLSDYNSLKLCTTDWYFPNRSSLPCFSLYYYYPVSCDWEATDKEWDIRNCIWDFKGNKHTNLPDFELKKRRLKALNYFFHDFQHVLSHFFGNQISKLTFVTLPASTKMDTDRRFESFSKFICSELNMTNGFDHIHIIKDGLSKNSPNNTSGRSIPAELTLDEEFFKNKFVILFDDVITSGATLERFRKRLEAAGAFVIGAISLGKTKHTRQNGQPMDRL